MSTMLRPIFFIFSMFFLVFYSYVTYIAFNPNVSNEYRLYYIEKKLLHWNNGEGLSYTLGTTLDFSKNIPYLSRHGWSHKEKSSTFQSFILTLKAQNFRAELKYLDTLFYLQVMG